MKNYPVIEGRKIRIGLVGCGRIAKNHFGAIKTYPDDFELVAVCDNEPEALKQATDAYGVTGYLSLTDMLKNEELDTVSICTPSGIHPEQAIEIAKAGLHVIS